MQVLVLMLAVLGLSPVEQAREVREVRWLLVEWRDAWERRDVDAFIDCYAESYRSGPADRAALRRQKQQIFSRSRLIEVRMDDIRIEVDGNRARAVFLQTFSSDQHRDRGVKTLSLEKEASRWRIVAEAFQPVG